MADEYFTNKDYLNAKASYQMAIDVNPKDPYARQRMNETLELLRSNKAQNILYDVTIASADKLFAAKDYEKARSQYEDASRILPGEAYPKEKINAIIKILVDQQVRDELYLQAITAADGYYTSGKFQRALLEYQKAIQQKPAEPYPQERINELKKLLADIAALEETYKDAISRADNLFAGTRYKDARSGYEEALLLKPKEVYPAQKISEIDGILARLAKNDADFDRFVNRADSFYMDRDFVQARQNYQLALQIKPNESYPKAMLAKTSAGVGELEALALAEEQAYQAAISTADQLFGEENLAEAKKGYENALTIKPREEYPRQKIVEIDGLLASVIARQRELDTQYNRIIENADRLFSDTLYPRAKDQYLAALKLKPDEEYPSQKIGEIDSILTTLEQQKEAIEIRYTELISVADKKMELLEYPQARKTFQEALTLKPKEPYPSGKIREIDNILAERTRAEKLETEYNAAVALGDSLLAIAAYGQSKAAFETAISLKPKEVYPATKISEIETLMAELAMQQTLNQQYDQAIANADQLFATSDWVQAKTAYQKAQGLKPGETYPAQQLVLIDERLAEIAKNEALDQQYSEVIASAEKYFNATKYDSARISFTFAQTLKPAESLPGLRIAQIDSILAALADHQAMEEKYAMFISSSDKLFEDKDYEASKAGYQQALLLKPHEQYPSFKVLTIDSILAENARAALLELQYTKAVTWGDSLISANLLVPARGEFENASRLKPEEEYPKTKIADIDLALQDLARQEELEKGYRQEIETGDRLFTEKSWDPAIAAYKRASGLKPNEEYPTQKINEIDSIIQEIARLIALDKEYLGAITNGEKLLAGKDYDSARVTFTAAQSLKPSETLPGIRIAQIDSILLSLAAQKALDEEYAALVTSADKFLVNKDYSMARGDYSKALALKPSESYPASKVTEIDGILKENARLAALELQYTGAINRGDSLLSADLLTDARGEFETASVLKPGETYPKAKLAEIDLALEDLARQQALDKKYLEELETGDRLFADKSWAPAVAAYERAGKLKPSETYPGQQIDKIESIRKEIVRQLEIDSQYKSIIARADQLFNARSLDSSRIEFARAGELKPEQSYWQEQIAEIDRLLAEQKRINEEYQAGITSADALLAGQKYEEARDGYQSASLIKPAESYPREKIKEINKILAEILGLRKTFDLLVTNGDQFFASKEYYKASENFRQALELFPDESHPKEQLRIANVKIDSIYRANKADYDKAVGEGDGFFNSYEYDKAIDAYTRAITFLPREDYPRQMIAKIRKTISENAIADVLNTPVIIRAGEEQKFPFDPVNIASRRNNFIYLKVKNLSDNSFNILMRYGKGNQTSGGLAIRNVSTDGEVNERLISVKDQDPWYREDNNWISIYPQGGDVEVSFIQVSRAIK